MNFSKLKKCIKQFFCSHSGTFEAIQDSKEKIIICAAWCEKCGKDFSDKKYGLELYLNKLYKIKEFIKEDK